ncbi:MAG: B12-binding domain-containing radical SAM protein [Peptococcaceae bacterium]|nr:B12-binding domain-containing radical SAM protein [Peptococcaceae bacterium]
MKKKILFIQPTIYDERGRPVKKNKLYFVGLAYPLLAAMLPDGWECEICLETIEDIPYNTDADVIGIGGMGHAANRSKDIALEFKRRDSRKIVIMGGPMASLAPELAKQYFDSVVIGDAEEVWGSVLTDIEHGELRPFYKKEIHLLKTPLPRYELLMKKKIGDFLPVQAGRGCPNSCKFCSISCLYRGKYLKRDIPDVIRDITYIKELGFKKFLLIDDNIASDEAYMRELCGEIKKLNMRWMSQCELSIGENPGLLKAVADSGCYMLSFGLESLNSESLKTVNKSWCDPAQYRRLIHTILSAGIEIASEMIVGIDTDTRESLLNTVDFIREAGIIAPKFYILTPIPGTDLYNDMQREHRIVEEDVFRFKPSWAVITHPTMATEEITEVFWRIYNRLYTIPKILRRTVFTRRFFHDPFLYLFLLSVNLYYRYQIKRGISPNIM